jgi:6-phosphogluconolactonase (cycloisomerase 2 family)
LHSADKLLAAAAALTTPRTTLPVYAAAAKLLLPVPGQKDPDGLTWAATIAIDATGSFLYAAEPGDSTQNGTYIGAIRQMRIAADGSVSDLNPRRVVAGIEPRGLATDPSGRFLYVANYGETSISQFAIAADGRLVPLVPPKVAFSNGNPGTLSVDPSGNYLFATGYSPGGSPVTAFAIAADGTLTEKQNAYATQYAAFVSAQPTLSGAGTTFLFTTAAGSGGSDPPELRTFEVGPGGTVTSANVFQSAPSVPKDYLGAVLADPSRAVVYATRSSGSLVPFSIDVAGKITEIPAGSAAFGGSSEAIVMNPAHDRLYVASAGPDHVWQYSVAADGKLGALTPPSVAATVPFAMVMNPAGTRMYVLNGNATGAATDIVQVFTIAADGTLSQP